MRHLAAAAAALGLFALTLPAAEAAEEDATRRLLTSEELRVADPRDRPVILRGSPIAPKAARTARPSTAPQQIVAGRRLWLIDPTTEDVRTCAVHRTTDVGVREIRCQSGTTGRFRRTFGPTFNP